MTKQLVYQVEVFNKEEAIEYFKTSNYEDCRINAYPSFSSYHGINRTSISFLMVDLELKDFVEEDQKKKAKAVLERALNKTLQNIKVQFNLLRNILQIMLLIAYISLL
jgi:hypothetical protein